MKKPFSRGQTQVLFRHLPGAVFEHEDYGLCRVTSVTQEVTDEINRDALFEAMADLLIMWTEPRFIEKLPDPRDAQRRSQYAIGAPKSVQFEPFPATFICRRCARTARFSDLQRRKATGSGTCVACGGTLARIRYVQAHNCGRMQELFVPARCESCGNEHVAFLDPGRVKHARWFCAKCKNDLQAMRMTPCNCAYSASISGAAAFSPEKWLKIVPTGDPSLHIVHAAAFVNFSDTASASLRTAPDSMAIVLGRIWGIVPSNVEALLEERQRVSKEAADSEAAELVEALRAVNPEHPKVKAYDQRRAKPKGQDYIVQVNALLSKHGQVPAGVPRRCAMEHVALMDRTHLTTTTDVADMLRRRDDEEGANAMCKAAEHAYQRMGIRRVRVINDFPLTLAAFGFTRLSRDPARAVLSTFPADERGKFPIYALSSETEALWFELSPLFVAQWLQKNGLLPDYRLQSEEDAWACLYARIPGLNQNASEPAYSERAAVAVRTLLHTMSHVFLRRIEWSGFSPSSVGEYLLPGSLSFVLYANRHAETRIAGLRRSLSSGLARGSGMQHNPATNAFTTRFAATTAAVAPGACTVSTIVPSSIENCRERPFTADRYPNLRQSEPYG